MDKLRDNELASRLENLFTRMENREWLHDDDIMTVIHIISSLGSETVLDVISSTGLIDTSLMESDDSDFQLDKEKKFVIVNSNNIESLFTRKKYAEHRNVSSEIIPIDDSRDSEDDLITQLEREMEIDSNYDINNNNNQPTSVQVQEQRQFKLEDKYSVLEHLGFEDKSGDWEDRASILLIPILGPQLSENCISYSDYFERNHWSLLCYYPNKKRYKKGKFFHYDSKKPLNRKRAGEVVSILKQYDVVHPEAEVDLDIWFAPQQPGGWECGYIVIFLMLIILAKNPPRPLSQIDIRTRFKAIGISSSETLLYVIKRLVNEKQIEDKLFIS